MNIIITSLSTLLLQKIPKSNVNFHVATPPKTQNPFRSLFLKMFTMIAADGICEYCWMWVRFELFLNRVGLCVCHFVRDKLVIYKDSRMISRIRGLIASFNSLCQQLQYIHPATLLSSYQRTIMLLEEQSMKGESSDIVSDDSNQQNFENKFVNETEGMSYQWLENSLEDIQKERWLENIRLTTLFQRQLIQQVRTLREVNAFVHQQFGSVQKFKSIHQQAKKEQKRGQNHQRSGDQYTLINKRGQSLRMTLNGWDYIKLQPCCDLNDAVIQHYLKLITYFMLPQETVQKFYFFSTYMISKLLKEAIEYDPTVDPFSDQMSEIAVQRVQLNYDNVKRWTRREDIFSKQILIFPINMYMHWFCVLVLNPWVLVQDECEGTKCEIIFCDSMYPKRKFVVDSVRTYLRLELENKKMIQKTIDAENVPDYQLLLPRQTNTHDCGLYMLTYIQELLSNKETHLSNLHDIENRLKLNFIPRLYIDSARHRLMKLFTGLYLNHSPSQVQKIIQGYLSQRHMLFSEHKTDDEFINFNQYQKYEHLLLLNRKKPFQQFNQEKFKLLIKFYYSSQINYYSLENVCEVKEEESSDFL